MHDYVIFLPVDVAFISFPCLWPCLGPSRTVQEGTSDMDTLPYYSGTPLTPKYVVSCCCFMDTLHQVKDIPPIYS